MASLANFRDSAASETITDALYAIEELRQRIRALIPGAAHVELTLGDLVEGQPVALLLGATLQPFADPARGKFLLEMNSIEGVVFFDITSRLALDSTSRQVIRARIIPSEHGE